MGYDENITKKYRVYAPNLGYTIYSSNVKFNENVKEGNKSIDLKLRTPATLNELPDRKPRGRPRQLSVKRLEPVGIKLKNINSLEEP